MDGVRLERDGLPHSDDANEEIAERGEAIYARDIECTLTPADKGKMVVIDIETGEYEIDESDYAATRRMLDKRPDAVTYGLRVGHAAANHLVGSHLPRTLPERMAGSPGTTRCSA